VGGPACCGVVRAGSVCLDSVLYLNGKEASRASNEFQVARSSGGGIAVAWLGPRMTGRRIQ
jgi:hypothetical protein